MVQFETSHLEDYTQRSSMLKEFMHRVKCGNCLGIFG